MSCHGRVSGVVHGDRHAGLHVGRGAPCKIMILGMWVAGVYLPAIRRAGRPGMSCVRG